MRIRRSSTWRAAAEAAEGGEGGARQWAFGEREAGSAASCSLQIAQRLLPTCRIRAPQVTMLPHRLRLRALPVLSCPACLQGPAGLQAAEGQRGGGGGARPERRGGRAAPGEVWQPLVTAALHSGLVV